SALAVRGCHRRGACDVFAAGSGEADEEQERGDLEDRALVAVIHQYSRKPPSPPQSFAAPWCPPSAVWPVCPLGCLPVSAVGRCQDHRVLIDIVVYDGLDEMDALGPLEVLRSASRNADLSVRLVTRE